jgi:hypothetical protein
MVKRKNLIAAYTRRPLPQMPITRYIGNSRASKKMKNRRRSRATNAPSIAVSSASRAAMKYTTCFSIRHEARIDSGIRNAVSTTMNTLIPSTPRM